VQVIVVAGEGPQLRAEVAADLPHGVLAAAEHARIEDTARVTKTKWT
jgi:hypothetical protein